MINKLIPCLSAIVAFGLLNTVLVDPLAAQMPANYQLENDWLVNSDAFKADIRVEADSGRIILSNGLVEREIDRRLGTTVRFSNLMTGQAIIRAIEPEGSVTLDGVPYSIGGAQGQPNKAFVTTDWLESMKPLDDSLTLVRHRIGEPEERLGWKQIRHHAPDAVWPPKGKYLRLEYAMPELSSEQIRAKLQGGSSSNKGDNKVAGPAPDSSTGRKRLLFDDFTSLNEAWKIHVSKSNPRCSFQNEGKIGEIYTPANTCVFAEQALPKGTRSVEVKLDVGTDISSSWGPGIGLVFDDRTVKFNVRPQANSYDKFPMFGAYDGSSENARAGGRVKLDTSKPWTLRLRITDTAILLDAKTEGGIWRNYSQINLEKPLGEPTAVRLGKMDVSGGNRDHDEAGELVRLRLIEFAAYSEIDPEQFESVVKQIKAATGCQVSVHYEIYDGLPLISKWITIENKTKKKVRVDRFTAERLAVVEHSSFVESRNGVPLPAPDVLHVETDMAFGGFKYQSANRHTVHWRTDKTYSSQVNYLRGTPALLVVEPTFGPAQDIEPGKSFETFRTFELAQDSSDRERRGLGVRKMYRTIAPWVTENPLMMHCVSSKEETIRTAIDQAAKVGFEMVILSFGSGFNSENDSEEYLAKWKTLNDYATSKGIHLGSYSLYSSRSGGKGNDIVPPKGMSNAHGRCPAITSPWGQTYIKKLYNLFEKTGFLVFEHDGPYPGDVDTTERLPLQKGVDDSRWVHWQTWTDFYKHLRAKGVYMNLPDFYYLSGSNKCGMGYREVNWSLPREQQRIHTRQNIYDGTWSKTPSMGWMFVPLTQYHGGGAAATIEPLDQHCEHYEIMMQSNLGLGVQACYRGPRLYDTQKTLSMVVNSVAWYKEHRDILESDLIHGRRADGQDIDWMLHVNPKLEEQAFLSAYNPTGKPITKTILVPLYFSGLSESATASENGAGFKAVELDSNRRAKMTITIPAQGYLYVVFKSPTK